LAKLVDVLEVVERRFPAFNKWQTGKDFHFAKYKSSQQPV